MKSFTEHTKCVDVWLKNDSEKRSVILLRGFHILPGSEHKEENIHSQMLKLCHGHVKAFCSNIREPVLNPRVTRSIMRSQTDSRRSRAVYASGTVSRKGGQKFRHRPPNWNLDQNRMKMLDAFRHHLKEFHAVVLAEVHHVPSVVSELRGWSRFGAGGGVGKRLLSGSWWLFSVNWCRWWCLDVVDLLNVQVFLGGYGGGFGTFSGGGPAGGIGVALEVAGVDEVPRGVSEILLLLSFFTVVSVAGAALMFLHRSFGG